MVIPTDDKTTGSGFPEAGTPGQEAAQEIATAVSVFLGDERVIFSGERGPENRVTLAGDVAQAVWGLVQAHKDDGETDLEDLFVIQACIAQLVDRILAEVYTAGAPSDRTLTLLQRFTHMLQQGSWYTAVIARKTLTELLDSEVPA